MKVSLVPKHSTKIKCLGTRLDESQLDVILEVHKRNTLSTSETCRSSSVTTKTAKQDPSKDDCSASRIISRQYDHNNHSSSK